MIPPPDEVHLWRIALTGPTDPSALAADERACADAYLRDDDRDRFIRARAGLRRVLGTATGRDPADLRFALGPAGKPALVGLTPAFNLSYRGAWALVGLTAGAPVGVDLERIRPLTDLTTVARGVLSDDEWRRFGSLPEADRLESFFSLWTAKEAYLKARGVGLSVEPSRCTVTLSPRPTVSGPDDPAIWRLHRPTVARGYVAAVVAPPSLRPIWRGDG